MGLLFFIPPLVVIGFKLAFRLRCKKAFGQVVRIERNYDPEAESTRIQPVIEFRDYRGKFTEFKTGIGYGLKYMPKLNDEVKIYYRPDTDPLQGQVASRGLWEVSVMLMLTGLVLMLPMILQIFFSR
jgi:hypothetical protein